MDPIVLERVAAGWKPTLLGLAFRGAQVEPAGARLFFGPPPGGRGATWALACRWPEPLWLWLDEAPLPKERERLDAVRKFEGLVVADVGPPAFDRRVRIQLARPEAAAPGEVFWEIEAWPQGNLLLVDGRRGVVWVARRRQPSTKRPALGPGVAYSDPPPAFRSDPRAAQAEDIERTLGAALAAGPSASPSLADTLAHHWAGVPGALAAHAAASLLASSARDASVEAARLREWADLAYAPDAPVLAFQWTDKHRSATLVSSRLPVVPPAGVEVLGPWPGWAEAARGLAASLPAAITAEELAQARSRVRRSERALAAVERDWVEAQRAPALRAKGEALAAYHTQVPRRASRVELPDPADSSRRLTIELDPRLATHQNANDYFRRAAKLERALMAIPARRKLLIDEVVKTRAHLESLERGERPPGATPPAAGGGTLSPARPARSTLGPRPARQEDIPARLQPRRYRTQEGWEVWIGKTNEGNDYLTHRLARPEDYWFHVQGSPGSHVVLRRGKAKDEPSRDTLREVAAWAAFYSKQRSSGTVPVMVTRKKYVRKPRGSKPGLAEVLRDEKTLFVRPAEPGEEAVVENEHSG